MSQARLTTEQLATQLGIKPGTIRAQLCRNENYYGLKPVKAPNRFLLWPADSVDRIIRRGSEAPDVAQGDQSAG